MNSGHLIRCRTKRIGLTHWLIYFMIGAIFFYTGHDIKRGQYIIEQGIEHFNPSEEEAEHILEESQRGSTSKALAYLILGTFGAITLVIQRRMQINGLLGETALLFLLWSFMSLLWADDRMVTFNKLGILSMMSLGALAGAKLFSDKDLLLLAVACTGTYLLIGVASEVALGSFQPWVPGYRFSGTIHPNGQGLNCALLFLSALYMGRSNKTQKIWWALLGLIAIVFLFLTKSRTPIGLLIFTLLAIWGLQTPFKQKVVLLSLIGVLLCLVLLLGDTLFPPLMKILRLGRTDILDTGGGTTFMARIELWELCWSYIADRPILGHGYNSFWTLKNTFKVAEKIGWLPGSAHSIYVETLLGVGLVGLVGLISMLFLAIKRLFSIYAKEGKPSQAFLLAILMFALVHGMLESSFIFPGMHTFLCMLTIAYLGFRTPEATINRSPPVRSI